MQKLISKNPILRFKERRKIIKAKKGTFLPVIVGENTYQYNPWTKQYTGAASLGTDLSNFKKDLETNFKNLYESLGEGNNAVYRHKGTRLQWINLTGCREDRSKVYPDFITILNLSRQSETSTIPSISNTEKTIYYNLERAKQAYKLSQQLKRIDLKSLNNLILKADRSNDPETESYRLNEESLYNNLSLKKAYNKARQQGKRYFGYRGKVYDSDLEKPNIDNLTEMKIIYGEGLGWNKDPKFNTEASRRARKAQNKQIKTEKNGGVLPSKNPITRFKLNKYHF